MENRLTILEEVKPKIRKNGKKRKQFKCQCNCGNIVIVTKDDLQRGHTKSCGCLLYSVNGLSYTYEYRVWINIKQRCYNKKAQAYKDYGGRGIRLYKKWYDDFLTFYDYIQKELGPRPSNLYSLDRKNNDGHYVPSNLKWSTSSEQAKNAKRKIIIYKFIELGNDYY